MRWSIRELRDLIASVTTALDEYRREAAEDEKEDTTPQEAISAPAEMVDPAIAQSTRLELRLAEATITVEETTRSNSLDAENLLRQIRDAHGLNRIARTELRMPRIVVHWYRRTIHALRDYPTLIKKTATNLKDGADILHLGVERWHDFKRNSTTFLFDELKKTCDSFVVVGTKLDELKTKKLNRGASQKTKSNSRPAPPEDFDWDKLYQMILAGIAPPRSWGPFVDHLRLDRKTEMVDLKPISGLTFVNWLTLWRSPVSDLTPIADLKRLKFLNLTETGVSDVTPLSKLRALDVLYLEKTPVTDISALASLKRLRELDLSYTSISDISALAFTASLEKLNLENTHVYDLRPLSKLENLTQLRLANTPVRDIMPLTGVHALEKVDLEGTLITSVHALRHLTFLEELNIARTRVKSVSSLRPNFMLRDLDIRRTLVTDVSPLDHIGGLRIEGAKTRRVLKRLRTKKKKAKR